jgi:hypothetical protein
MATIRINGIKLKRAIEEFGSIQKAVEALQTEKLEFDKYNSELKRENAQLKLDRDKLTAGVKTIQDQLAIKVKQLELLTERAKEYGHQYELFEDFVAMLTSSPPVTESVKTLIALFQNLLDQGWSTSRTAEDLRSIFVQNVMGDYLKCFRCDSCGARFIVNKEPHHKYYSDFYQCPACHLSLSVKADDMFLKAMISEQQMENICRVETLQQENKALQPLKVFLNLPCEVCGQPITEWTEEDVRRGVSGLGWGHTQCWNTTEGTARQFAKLVRQELERRTRNY